MRVVRTLRTPPQNSQLLSKLTDDYMAYWRLISSFLVRIFRVVS